MKKRNGKFRQVNENGNDARQKTLIELPSESIKLMGQVRSKFIKQLKSGSQERKRMNKKKIKE